MYKKSQGGIDFMIIAAVVVIFFTVFFIIVQDTISSRNNDKQVISLNEIALTVQDEINLALDSTNGYSREFILPSNVLGQDYSLAINNNFIYLNTSKNYLSLRIGNFSGTIKKGNNTITKQNDKVYIN